MHITITGRLGSGKTTVCRILSDKYGYEIYSTGKINRAIAAEKGITALEMNELMAKDLSFDHMIDDAVSRISREMRDRTLIFDSRMAWHFACDSFKVFMHIDPAIAAKRVMADDRGAVEKYTDADDARRQLLARATAENTRYRRIYGTDNLDYRNFDLVADSATITPEALAALILSEFELYRSSPAEYGSPKLMLSPLAIYPTATVGEMESRGKLSRILPCVAAKYCAAWAALPSTTLPAGKVLAARSRRWYSTPAALAAARMFLVASTA